MSAFTDREQAVEELWSRVKANTRRPAACCHKCGDLLPPGATIYHFRTYLGRRRFDNKPVKWQVSYCAACTPQTDGYTARCSVCERPIVRNAEFCSLSCEWKYYRDARRQAVPERACVVCGEQFAPKRKDTTYCGAACKQKAYRKRGQPEKIVGSTGDIPKPDAEKHTGTSHQQVAA